MMMRHPHSRYHAVAADGAVDWDHPLNTGKVGWWFAPSGVSAAGGVIKDLARKWRPGVDGTLTNSAGWKSGSLEFIDGSTNWVNCGTISALSPAQSYVGLQALVYCRSTQSASPNIRNIAGCD